MEGMVQLMYRSSPAGPAASICVMQLALPTVWAGSWKSRRVSDGVNSSGRADGGRLIEGPRVRWPLRRYLPAGDVDGCHDVGGVGVEAPNAAGHG